MKKIKERFSNLYSASFDRGYHSPKNQEDLSKLVEKLVLPKKGNISKKESERIKEDKVYQSLRKEHSKVESNINSLEHHGLDRCPDNGIVNFRRYVSMSILAHNIHLIGVLAQRKKQRQSYSKEAYTKLAA